MRRRYSDFELLAAYFARVYPYYVVPPIPEKPTFTELLASSIPFLGGGAGTGGKHDPVLIQHRIRLFQAFMANVVGHVGLAPVEIGRAHV